MIFMESSLSSIKRLPLFYATEPSRADVGPGLWFLQGSPTQTNKIPNLIYIGSPEAAQTPISQMVCGDTRLFPVLDSSERL